MAAKLAIFGRRSASQHREFEMKLYPPFLVLIGILGQIIVGQFVPIEPVLGPVWQTIGIGLVVLGLVMIFAISRSFRQAETTIIPDGAPSILLQTGLFTMSRNPIYVGMAVILSGTALLTAHIWAFVFVVFFVVAVDRLWIVKEEVNLEAEFGQQYRDYKQRVRRWL
jgi:protein-S-isoprenylcysteine O-methyltransferase Ste14